jgi:hypothetical protein
MYMLRDARFFLQAWKATYMFRHQGDKIGRIFLSWASVRFSKSTEVAKIIGRLFPMVKPVHQFCQRAGLTSFWAIFSQTYPVTLIQHEKQLPFENLHFNNANKELVQ